MSTDSKTPNMVMAAPSSMTSTATEDPASALTTTMEKVDPFLRFLTKATGKTMVPLCLLLSVLPRNDGGDGCSGGSGGGGEKHETANDGHDGKPNDSKEVSHSEEISGEHEGNTSGENNANKKDPKEEDNRTKEMKTLLQELTYRGVLQYRSKNETVGFPLPPAPTNSNSNHKSVQNSTNRNPERIQQFENDLSRIQTPPSKLIGKGLHSSSEIAAKRRLKVLKWTLERVPHWIVARECGVDLSIDCHEKDLDRASATNASASTKTGKCGVKSKTRKGAKKKGADEESSASLLATTSETTVGASSVDNAEATSADRQMEPNANKSTNAVVTAGKVRKSRTSNRLAGSRAKKAKSKVKSTNDKSNESSSAGRNERKEPIACTKEDGVVETNVELGEAESGDSSMFVDGTSNDNDHKEMTEVEKDTESDLQRKAAYRALHNLWSGFGYISSQKEGDSGMGDRSVGDMDKHISGIDSCTESNNDSSVNVRNNSEERHWLPCQAAHAGSHPGRKVRYGTLSKETLAKIPVEVLKLFGLENSSSLESDGCQSSDNKSDKGKSSNNATENSSSKMKLFLHQARAIEASMNGLHTVVCTGTGSGKSLCFLLPVLAKAMVAQRRDGLASHSGSVALLIYPTKALAQDQFSKINKLLQNLSGDRAESSSLQVPPLRAGVIDGDTPHSQRDAIAMECQIILTNPDTLHAAILPNWKKKSAYQQLLARLGRDGVVVVDEMHVYEGALGAHVSMVLRRLKRVCRVASSPSTTGLAASEESSNNESSLCTHQSPATSASSSLLNHVQRKTGSENMKSYPLFIGCSATMIHPEQHFRLLCPITKEEEVCVLTSDDDGSPCAPKHYFVWNPPILDMHGNSTGSVFLPKLSASIKTDERQESQDIDETNAVSAGSKSEQANESTTQSDNGTVEIKIGSRNRGRKRKHSQRGVSSGDQSSLFESTENPYPQYMTRRRHAADETAFLLAKAISTGTIRCIAFCQTRMLVEWVYERCISILQSDPNTSKFTTRLESYRGGYSTEARRSIEDRLFNQELWGVVGTNALELGVDVGGIDLTLHCGYPGSINSVLQQSGRAGRGRGGMNSKSGKSAVDVPSLAIMVSFSAASEQYLWRNPKSLLSTGVKAPPTLPVNGSVVQGHLLCAGEEFPLTGDKPVSCLLNELSTSCDHMFPADKELLGPRNVYDEGISFLVEKGLLVRKVVQAVSTFRKKKSKRQKRDFCAEVSDFVVYSTHPVVKNPWTRVSLRSIEPLNYSIVDLSHPMQGGRTDKIYDKSVVMDTIPYSRVFYHAFPGAIIMHRGRKYRIESMESPPPFVGGNSYGPSSCSDLAAFAKPTNLQYSTQALSVNQITVVKVIEHAETTITDAVEVDTDNLEKCVDTDESIGKTINPTDKTAENLPSNGAPDVTSGSVAGNGIVTCKRSVHGYKKLSHVNRKELSRTTILLPPMEFDTYGLWIDADASYLRDLIVDFNSGVHALSHAMVAVAPLFVPCSSSDLDCDHSRYECTRVLLYDARAGGSGITSQLYSCLVECLESAVDLLEDCTSCYNEKRYDGGCPGCLQSVRCDSFHQDLSRKAGVLIGRHLLKRLRKSNLRQRHDSLNIKRGNISNKQSSTDNDKGLECMQLVASVDDMQNTVKPKNILVGRASWMDNNDRARWAEVDD